jgi:aerobic-type carbon monoxide dehydrogenase small subunit (CoxS/CutS family)
MHTFTVKVDDSILDKFLWLFENFPKNKIEILEKIDEDSKDLKLLQETRNDEKISFEEYLKNES